MLNYLNMQTGCYGFRTMEDLSEMATQIETVGLEKRESIEYYFDGMKRNERGRYLFQYTLSGWGILDINSKEYRVNPGQAFLTTIPSEDIYYKPKESKEWNFIFIMIFGYDVQKYWDEITNEIEPVTLFSFESPVIRLLFDIYKNAVDGRITDCLRSSALAYQFIMELYRSTKFSAYEEISQKVNEALHIIRSDYNQLMGINDVAQRLGISACHLIREFSNEMGCSPGKYITKVRMEQAVELLQNTDMLVNEIAKSIGYSNGNYFSKVFSKYFGMAPVDFRRGRSLISYTNINVLA